MIADDLIKFAEKTIQLMTDHEFYSRIAAFAGEFVAARYNCDAISMRPIQIYGDLTSSSSSPKRIDAWRLGGGH